MKILFLTNIPSPYRVKFFNELGKKCDLTVLYERKQAENRDKSWNNYCACNYKEIFLKGKIVGEEGAICVGVLRYLKMRKYTHIIICGYGTPTSKLAILWLKIHYIPFIMNVDGGLIKEEKRIKYMVKRFFIQSAVLWFSTGEKTTEFLVHYGADKKRCYKYLFSSFMKSEILDKVVSEEEKLVLKENLHIKEKKMVLSVGQFIYRKGFDILLRITKDFPENTATVIIGGEPTKEYLSIVEKYKLKHIYFIGFKEKEELAKYYMAADVFVFPTREDIWGLVINEAMSYGLPVIVSKQCVAGAELIESGRCGYQITLENQRLLLEKTKELLLDNRLRRKMAEESLKKIKNYSIENMAEDYIKILTDYIK